MLRELIRKFFEWRRKVSTYKKYKDTTKYHLVGDRYDIGDFTYGVPEIISFDSRTKLTIGKYCSLARGLKIMLGGNHPVKWVSTYPFYRDTHTFSIWNPEDPIHVYRGDVRIGNDVWIGADALILSGAEIGDGAVIGVGAVVAGKIPPYSIAVGNPARVIKKRFSDDVIEKLLKIQWWNWDETKINSMLPLMCSEDISKFIENAVKIDKSKSSICRNA